MTENNKAEVKAEDEVVFKSTRHTGSWRLVDEDGKWYHLFTCPGQSYEISQEQCDTRQERGYYKGCRRCRVRRDGVDDPRAKLPADTTEKKE